MVVTRSGEAGCLVLATCALFDTRVFLVSHSPFCNLHAAICGSPSSCTV